MNAWLGVTVDVARSKERIDYLRNLAAGIKFLSCEPLLEELGEMDLTGIDWVICWRRKWGKGKAYAGGLGVAY